MGPSGPLFVSLVITYNSTVMSRARRTPENALREELPARGRFLLAVSGGIDSMSLLYACAAVQKKIQAHLEVAHVDHGIRKDSAKDADLVAREAERLGFPFHLKKGAPPKTGNLEAWGRSLRYKFFAVVLEKAGLDYVLTAHTASDVAENFLMRLLSNKEPRAILRLDPRRKCIRPFLDISRAEIERYAQSRGVPFCADLTNADTRFLRNRGRHKLIPLLQEQFDPRIVEVLSNRAERWAQDFSVLDDLCEEVLKRLAGATPWSKPWRRGLLSELSQCPQALHWRVVEQALFPKLGFRVGGRHARWVVDLLRGEREAVELPGGVCLRSKDGAIAFFEPSDSKASVAAAGRAMTKCGP
jgi:tRNA(Ile)-lysidine synthase